MIEKEYTGIIWMLSLKVDSNEEYISENQMQLIFISANCRGSARNFRFGKIVVTEIMFDVFVMNLKDIKF